MRIPLTRYGLREIIASTVLCGAAGAACLYFLWPGAVVFALLWLALLSFFRDPERPCAAGDHQVLCAADGRVADIEGVEAPAFLDGKAVRVGTFMSVLNVHVNRAPAAGTVRYVERVGGTYHDARDPRSITENAHVFIGLELDDGRKLLVNLIAGVLARQIVCGVRPGDTLERGQRIGMVKFGSRVEVFLPADRPYRVLVEVGDRVKAGRDVLAELEAESQTL